MTRPATPLVQQAWGITAISEPTPSWGMTNGFLCITKHILTFLKRENKKGWLDMRAHLMITKRRSPDKKYIVLFHLRLVVCAFGLSFKISGRLFKMLRNYCSFRIQFTQNILGNDWHVKIRPKKILQSTILQRHLIKHSLARNPELQNDLFFLEDMSSRECSCTNSEG